MDFELKLNNVEYKCTGTQYANHNQDWNISATPEKGFRISVHIPIEEKLTRAQVMVFTEALHLAFLAARKEQKVEKKF